HEIYTLSLHDALPIWDSELAVGNIENTLKKLNIDLCTYVIDWEEFKDLQLSFLRASTSDGEIPTDHAILATLYRVASQHGVRYIDRKSTRLNSSHVEI